MQYRYKDNRSRPRGLEADTLGNELQRIKDKHKGQLRCRDVVDESRPKDAVLHNHFEWRDREAAEKYRLCQARSLINILEIVTEERPREPVPAFVNVAAESAAGEEKSRHHYRTISEVLNDPDEKLVLLRSILRKLSSLRRQYTHIKELAKVWNAVDDTVAEMFSFK